MGKTVFDDTDKEALHRVFVAGLTAIGLCLLIVVGGLGISKANDRKFVEGQPRGVGSPGNTILLAGSSPVSATDQQPAVSVFQPVAAQPEDKPKTENSEATPAKQEKSYEVRQASESKPPKPVEAAKKDSPSGKAREN
jgi:hypothetical protein